MRRLWAIDDMYSLPLREIQEMSFSVQDRKDLEVAFDEVVDPYWIDGSTAFIKIQGVLSRQWSFETWLMGGLPTGYLQSVFQKAASSADVDRIVLLFDSPGGEVSGLSEFAQVIRDCPKAVHAHISGHCTSGAYWLASQADAISASKTSMIGSIGAFISFLKAKDSGYEAITFRSSEYKAPEPDTDAGKQEYQKLVDQIASVFEADVAIGRNVAVKTVQESYGQGRVFLAEEALAIGLIDGIENTTQIGSKTIGGSEMRGGSMNTEKEVVTEVKEVASNTPYVGTLHAAADAERERIKTIIALGGSDEITNEAIDKRWSVETTAVKVSAFLKAQLEEMKANRASDAKVLEDIPQDPAGEIKVSGDQKNIFGIERTQIDAELDRFVQKEA